MNKNASKHLNAVHLIRNKTGRKIGVSDKTQQVLNQGPFPLHAGRQNTIEKNRIIASSQAPVSQLEKSSVIDEIKKQQTGPVHVCKFLR